ncbi:type IX secretion system ring subunit PorN/GldN [Fulvivirga sediminis]|uniref:Gliding motility protein GldN n=1 Tax=Fulvivirga sediminis TaxID=2803949 RepID=A0A937F7A5_9BACT|nr:gliding motility protein GldN [Fulvivirga sediminis]MBL3657752.1 gliding motility protein GldN [Fulvivirga sediminis]
MINCKKFILVVFIGLLATPMLAQKSELDQYNPNSIEPIAKYEHLFKRRVWRTIDLKEKQNKGFFARGGEITAFILDAIRSGELVDLYTNDSLTTKMSKDEFLNRLVYQEGLEVAQWEPGVEYYEGDQVKYNGVVYSAIFDEISSVPSESPDDWEATPGVGSAILFLPRQISILRLMEDMIFDKRRSRLYYKPQSIQLIIPGSETLDGVELPLVVLKYKDLYKLFKDNPEEAIWINRYNSAENKNFADALTLREFRSSLFKFENPDDDPIVDMYKNRMEAIMAAEWWEMELMEKEHNLWEY